MIVKLALAANWLKRASILLAGSREFARLRIGIGRQGDAREITGHVLGRLSAGEQTVMEKVLGRAADQLECWLAHGLQKAMSQFNGVVTTP